MIARKLYNIFVLIKYHLCINNVWMLFDLLFSFIHSNFVFISDAGPSRKPDEEQSQNELQFAESLRWEAWFGSRDGLYHMHWP